MGSYTVYDFSESLARTDITREQIEKVYGAWGIQGDYAEWEGGFIFRLNDGQWIYLTGWCDTTGWGCQDGIEIHRFDKRPAVKELEALTKEFIYGEPEIVWDKEPADLNRYIKGEIDAFDNELRQ